MSPTCVNAFVNTYHILGLVVQQNVVYNGKEKKGKNIQKNPRVAAGNDIQVIFVAKCNKK